MIKYEYKTIRRSSTFVVGELEEYLDELGAEGWEVVCVIRKDDILLKRRVEVEYRAL